jgi:hypothetical protein
VCTVLLQNKIPILSVSQNDYFHHCLREQFHLRSVHRRQVPPIRLLEETNVVMFVLVHAETLRGYPELHARFHKNCWKVNLPLVIPDCTLHQLGIRYLIV